MNTRKSTLRLPQVTKKKVPGVIELELVDGSGQIADGLERRRRLLRKALGRIIHIHKTRV